MKLVGQRRTWSRESLSSEHQDKAFTGLSHHRCASASSHLLLNTANPGVHRAVSTPHGLLTMANMYSSCSLVLQHGTLGLHAGSPTQNLSRQCTVTAVHLS